MDVQPETNTMKLRQEVPKVTRLSRKMLLTVGIVGCLVIGGSLIYAFQEKNNTNNENELYSIDSHTYPDGLQSLSNDYSGPIIGKPAPGDLGAASVIQNQQVVTSIANEPVVDPYEQELEQKIREEIEIARLSGLFAPSQTKVDAAQQTAMNNQPINPFLPDLMGETLANQDHISRQQAFLNKQDNQGLVSSARIIKPQSPNLLQAGSVIPAALITGIHSDLPGQITAQVTQNVYDSPTGRILLIPQGTRLIGEYDNRVLFGQERILFVWKSLKFADGGTFPLNRAPGADAAGYSGVSDQVDHHWWAVTKAAALSVLLSIGSELAMDDDDDRLIRALRNGTQDTFNQAGQRIIDRQLNVPTTLKIRNAFPVRVIITQDLIIEPEGEEE
ncbi:TraB/TrbI/VirB10 family type IV secretion system protein [Bartonella sp. LJL80]